MEQYAGNKLAKLVIDNPDLPVYKMCEPDGEDDYVLQVTGAEVGEYWVYKDYIYDDYNYLFNTIYENTYKTEEEVEKKINKLEHGNCIWLKMNYVY